jgi:replicative DNA helicase
MQLRRATKITKTKGGQMKKRIKSKNVLSDIAKSKKEDGFIKAGKLTQFVLNQLEKLREHKNDITGLRTGFADFDALTAGLQPSDLIIIAARPSMGKTSLALNIAEHVAINEKKAVGIFSAEISKEALIKILVASIARIDGLKLRKGIFDSKNDWANITNAIEVIRKAPIYIDDSAYEIGDLHSRARKLEMDLRATSAPLSLIIIDYIQLLEGSGRFSANRALDIAEVSKALKALAKDLKIPIVVLSQLNRSVYGRKDNRPILSDLRYSGAIEQYADVVVFIHREFYYDKSDLDKQKSANLIIAKNRNGSTGDIDLIFEARYQRFSNALLCSK